MIRKIVKIDEKKCNGCGICADACHEGAIQIVNNKAKLVKDNYCDGLGDCLPGCPTGAISIEEREAEAYDENAVKSHLQNKEKEIACGCPGGQARVIDTLDNNCLNQWPIQIKLVPTNAPYFDDSELLIAADCTAFAYSNFYNDFIKNRITLIGCPKLDSIDYSEKISEIIKNNKINSIRIVMMEVPCCTGLENAVLKALQNNGKTIPLQTSIISINGKIIKNKAGD